MDAPILRFDRYSSPGPHILAVGPRVALEITRGRVQQRLRPVNRPVFLIGTANDCDLVLGDLTFPEAYAYLFVQDAKVTIRRLGAGPDLIVCDEQVETAELLDGDHVAFGPFELRMLIEEQPARRTESCLLAATERESSEAIADADFEVKDWPLCWSENEEVP